VRSYTYIDDMTDDIYRLMQSGLEGPVNVGNLEYVTVGELFRTVTGAAGKRIRIRHVDGSLGVQSRNFSNARNRIARLARGMGPCNAAFWQPIRGLPLRPRRYLSLSGVAPARHHPPGRAHSSAGFNG
jgi:nucleoside-diphosphate-sugar epimerase